MNEMRKTLTALAAAASIAAMAVATPTPADARCFGCAVGLGIIGGAIIGGAIANSYAAYAPAPGYVVYPGYGAPVPVACPGGYWARQQWVDQYGYAHWSRPRFFCPQ
jgi:hypothetical protein